jgi:hypothetical protein
MATATELREQAAAFLRERFDPPPWVARESFSAFDRRQIRQATRLARELGRVAAANGDIDGVADAIARAREEVKRQLPGLVKQALLIFLTHDPIGSRVGPPSLEERHPTAVAAMAETEAARTKEDPQSLAFLREDIWANDHHAHWHNVYTAEWVPHERQGELFLYMHQQMLARYDAERLGVGRPEIDALPVGRGLKIDEGYDPHMQGFPPRPDGQPLFHGGDLKAWRDSYASAIDNDEFEAALAAHAFPPEYDPSGPQPVLGLLGSVLEAENNPDPPLAQFFGANMHNSGHVFISTVGMDAQGRPLRGVMRDTSVAIRDPVFWRWHKVIDNVGFAWQEKQPARDFTAAEDAGPAVGVRDVILCTRSALGFDEFADEAAGTAWGEETFGGDRWDDDGAVSSDPATGDLATHMTSRHVDGRRVRYLDMVDEFAYFVRLENAGGAAVDTTVRIFAVPEEWAEDRRKWIEMDKFLHSAPPGRSVVYRPSALASVIRKPATRPPGPAPRENGHATSAYCQCGWPYNLLLPRGTKEGMPFRLMVMLTDANLDTRTVGACGSISYCGAKDRSYPDRRNMGYPFDRRFDGEIVATLDGMPNAATRTFTVTRST